MLLSFLKSTNISHLHITFAGLLWWQDGVEFWSFSWEGVSQGDVRDALRPGLLLWDKYHFVCCRRVSLKLWCILFFCRNFLRTHSQLCHSSHEPALVLQEEEWWGSRRSDAAGTGAVDPGVHSVGTLRKGKKKKKCHFKYNMYVDTW